jgi:hypothetical protein
MKVQLFPRLFILAAISLIFSVEAVRADDLVAKAYDIKDVSELVVSGGGRVQITQGDTESLRVEAASDVMERVKVDLSGDKLSLSVRNSSGSFSFFDLFKHRNDEVLYILQLKKLHYLSLSGASSATFGNWVGGDMKLNVSGAGTAHFTHLQVNDLFVELTGASDSRVEMLAARRLTFELSGAADMDIKAASQTNFLKIGASGASNFRGKLLKAAQADVHASGASNIDLHVTESLKANASGASHIRYIGKPELDSNSSGSSHIKAINN